MIRRVICLLLLFIFPHSGDTCVRQTQRWQQRGSGLLAGEVGEGWPGGRLGGCTGTPPPLPKEKRKDNRGKKKKKKREKEGKKFPDLKSCLSWDIYY